MRRKLRGIRSCKLQKKQQSVWREHSPPTKELVLFHDHVAHHDVGGGEHGGNSGPVHHVDLDHHPGVVKPFLKTLSSEINFFRLLHLPEYWKSPEC
jgi:hypothetical protein